jgi:hypothetical protein
MKEKINQLTEILTQEAIKRNWHNQYAKWNRNHTQDQSLIIHSLNQLNLMYTFIQTPKIKKSFSRLEKLACLIGSFLSDYGKSTEKFQQAVIKNKSEKEAYNHVSKEILLDVEQLLNSLRNSLISVYDKLDLNNDGKWDDFTYLIKNAICYHEIPGIGRIFNDCDKYGGPNRLSHLVKYVDIITSMKTVEDAYNIANKKLKEVESLFPDQIEFEYHKIRNFRGIISLFLMESLIERFKSSGYQPILSYPNGLLYLGINSKSLNFKNLRELIKKKIQSLLNDKKYQENLFNLTYGKHYYTPIIAPQLLNTDLIKRRFNKIDKVSEKEIKGEEKELKSRDKKEEKETLVMPFLDDFKKRFNIDRNVILKKYLAWKTPLVYWGALMKEFKNWSTESRIKDKFIKKLGFSYDNLKKGYSHRSKARYKLELITKLWDSFISDEYPSSKNNTKRFEVLLETRFNEQFKEWLIEKALYFFQLVQDDQPSIIEDEIFNQILMDIIYPIPESIKSITKNIVEAIEKIIIDGKDKKNNQNLCNFCSLPTSEIAKADLVGRGTRKFSNFLQGGKPFGDNRCATICSTCKIEAYLRQIIMGAVPNSYILVMPEMNMAPAIKRTWIKNIVNKLQNENEKSISLLNPNTLGRVIEKISKDKKYQIPINFLINQKIISKDKRNKIKKKFNKKLSKDYANFEEFLQLNKDLLNKDYESSEELIEAVLHNEENHKQILKYFPKTNNTAYYYRAPDYLLIFFKYEIGNDDDSESIKYMRKMWLAILISQLFFAKVKLIKSFNPFTIGEQHETIEIRKPALYYKIQQNIIKPLDETDLGKIILSNRMKVLIKLSKIMALESIDPESEQGFLLKIITKSKGYILNYFFQKDKRKKKIRKITPILKEW